MDNHHRNITKARIALYLIIIIVAASLAGAASMSWPRTVSSRFALKGSETAVAVTAPDSGRVTRVLVREGEWVESGDELLEFSLIAGNTAVISAVSNGFFMPDNQACSGVETGSGQTLARIVEGGPLMMQMGVGPGDLAAIRPGMPVIARLDAYPSQEYGAIEARITWVALIPGGQAADGSPRYTVQAEITAVPKGLGQRLRPGLLGQAEIITGEERLFDRLIPRN